MKYGELTLGQMEAVVNKLGGMDGVQRLLAGELVVKPASKKVFPIWKTIKLGTGLKTADDFREAIKDRGMKIGDGANDILGKPQFTVVTKETELDLVVISVAELGFKSGATREQIYARAKEFGLDLCPAEVGPQLRLQYQDQPDGEWLVIAMEPIIASVGDLELFSVKRYDSDLWLRGVYDYPASVWYAAHRFVFSRRK